MALSNAKNRGFTIVELMIAIMVGGVFILIITTGIMQVSRMYKQASIKTALLNAARELQTDIAGQIQYAAQTPIICQDTSCASNGYYYICAGETAYYWKDANKLSAAELNGSTQYFYKATVSGASACSSSYSFNTNSATAISPLPKFARATKFNLSGAGSGPYALDMRFVAGDKDLFESNNFNNQCITAAAGGQFCATVELNSVLGQKVQ